MSTLETSHKRPEKRFAKSNRISKCNVFAACAETSGIAYVAMLFLLVILTTMGLAFLYKVGVESSATLMRGDSVQAQYLAEAAANHAMWLLLNEPTFPDEDDVYYMHSLGNGRYGYKVRRHTDTTFATVATVGAAGDEVVQQSYVMYVVPSKVLSNQRLYWADKTSGKIQRSALDGSNVEDLVTGLGDVKAMELDLEDNKMYWTDKTSGKIQRSDLDGFSLEDLVTGLGDVKVMELDLTNGKVYWNDKTSGKMQRSDIDGSNVEDLVTGLGDVKVMELDIPDGKIYWNDKTSGKMQRSDLDGSNVQDLVAGLGDVKVMELDLTSGKIYWNDKTSGKMQRSNLDGSSLQDLVSGLGDVKAMELDLIRSKIYWYDKTSGKLQSSDLDGSNLDDLKSGLDDIKDIELDTEGGKIYWNNKDTGKNQRSNLDGSGTDDLVADLGDVKVIKLGTAESGIAGIRYGYLSEAAADNYATSITISIPPLTKEGFLLIAAVATDGDTSGSLAPPFGEGWTQIDLDAYDGEVTLGLWWKVADAGESATHQFSWSGSHTAYGWIMSFKGHDSTSPIGTISEFGELSANPNSPSVTSTVDNSIILRVGAFDGKGSPSYFTILQ